MNDDLIKLDEAFASTGTGTYHKAVLTFKVTQDDQPFMDMPVTYHHCNDAVVTYLAGMVVGMTAPLGPKGQKPKNQQFKIKITLDVDDQKKAEGEWDGLSREHSLLFEINVLETWLHMNRQSMVAAKAQGKI